MDRFQSPEAPSAPKRRKGIRASLRGTSLAFALFVLPWLWVVQWTTKETGPLPPKDLLSLLPEPPEGWLASAPRGVYPDKDGLLDNGCSAASLAERTYRKEDVRMRIQIRDCPGTAEGSGPWPFHVLKGLLSKQRDEKGRKQNEEGGWPARIVYNARERSGTLTVSPSRRLQVLIHGKGVGMQALQRWMDRIAEEPLCTRANPECLL